MNIVQKKIATLKLADYNPRKLSDKQEKELTESMRQFGFVQPLIVNSHPQRKNIVIGGHQRLAIAVKMGLKEVPCYMVSLSLEKERELNIRLNKNTGSWDPQKLQLNFNLTELLSFGFEKKELDFDVDAAIGKPKKKKQKANVETQFALGELRFTLPQQIYGAWMDALAKLVGVKKEKQVAEVMKRLKIEGRK